MKTYKDIQKEYPHLTEEEADMVARNANIGNRVPIPRTGWGSETNIHVHSGNPCIFCEKGEANEF